MKRIGVLTGGGDAPGLNAVIRAVVKTAVIEYAAACFSFFVKMNSFRDKTETNEIKGIDGIINLY